jgi:hypothetical protein
MADGLWLMEPLVHVDRLTIKDPEGTDVWSDITEEQAQHWAIVSTP